MTPRFSIIAASIRKALGGLAGDIGKYADEYWNSVVLALRGNVPAQDFKAETVLNMHMDGADADWGSVVLGMHMGGGEVDPYWSNVSLLMLMNGTNASTAIGDVTGKTVTVAGNAAISTTQSKFGGSSCYFDGTGDYLTVPGSSDFDFGTGDFTVELWVYIPTIGVKMTLVHAHNGSNTGLNIEVTTAGKLQVNDSATATTDSSVALSAATWTHVAVVCKNSVVSGYINGTLTLSHTAQTYATTTGVEIGRISSGVNNWLNGYIDNLRITKGVARYTDNFTPPNREFPAGATTIYDVKGHPVTVAGNTAIVATQSRFGGYSCYFDGTGDYLQFADSTDWSFGSGEFTVEFWMKSPGNGTYDQILGQRDAGGATNVPFGITRNSTASTLLPSYRNAGGTLTASAGTAIVFNDMWHHIVFLRQGDNLKLYVDGVLDVTMALTAGYSLYESSDVFCIGRAGAYNGQYYLGYIDDLRITKGVARYTAAFTPPTRAFPHDVAFFDEKGLVPAVTGAPTISTATLKYGYGSASFNGTTDYLTFDASKDFGLSTADFTIEAWVKTSAAGTLLDFRNYAADYGHFYLATGGYLAFDHTYGAIVGTTSVTDNNWHHVAFVRYKNILTLFVDGADSGAAIANANIGSNRQARVGAKVNGTNFFAGNIDELRVTKVARYVGEFTPQRYQFDDANNNIIWRDETGTKTITAYGNAQVYPATYKFGNGSMYFDGAGDYLSVPDSADWNFGTGDFTIEAWVNLTSYATNNAGAYKSCIVSKDLDGDRGFLFVVSGTSTSFTAVEFYGFYDNTNSTLVAGNFTFQLNTWYHLAVIRSGNIGYLFVNGTLLNAGGTAFTTAIKTTTTVAKVGGLLLNGTYTYYLNGFIDDLRITKGIARYVSAFNPPVRQNANYGLPAITDPYWDAVVLGLHMDGADNGTTFTDVKGNTVTANGNAVTKTATKKFGTASAYFDGTGDYLGITSTSVKISGDFTIECWINIANLDTTIASSRLASATGDNYWSFYVNANGALYFQSRSVTQYYAYTSNNKVTINTWTHVAVTRAGGIIRVFVNGDVGSTTVNDGNIVYSESTVGVGVFNYPGYVTYFSGYIDDLRITKGVARYTANFQPAQYAFPETRSTVKTLLDPYYDNVVLNMHMNGPAGSTAFVDEKGKAVTAFGNASLSTTQSKFGGVSAYFDGTGDYLTLDGSAGFAFGTGDFTVEGWVNFDDLTAARVVFDFRNGVEGAYPYLYFDATNVVYRFNTADRITAAHGISAASWVHFAVVRIAGSTFVYVNGQQKGSPYVDSSSCAVGASRPIIGVNGYTLGTFPHKGYLDDLRVTKGVARYTQSFTVPALPNPDFKTAPAATDPYWKNVVLHMPMNGADGGTTFTENTGKTVTVNGNTSTQVEQYRFGGSSAYFDGAGDYLSIPHAPSLRFGSSDFTIECWVYASSLPAEIDLVTKWNAGTVAGTNQWALFVLSGVPQLHCSTGGLNADAVAISSAITVNTWTHLAAVRMGNFITMFTNGVGGTPVALSGALYGSETEVLGISYRRNQGSTQYPLTGFIDDLRITKGVARYTANFTPPSLPNPTGYDPYAPNVVLHLPMAADFNDGTGNTVTVNGNTVISTTVKKLGAGSGYFDGTGDYLQIPASADLTLGTESFTIEMWIHPLAYGGGVGGASLFGTVNGSMSGWVFQLGQDQNNLRLTSNLTGSWADNLTVPAGGGPTLSTWTHLAFVRSGSNLTIYKNGQSVATTSSAGAWNFGNGPFIIGKNDDGTNLKYLNGYLSDLRITKGIARYTANFTPPREPFSLT